MSRPYDGLFSCYMNNLAWSGVDYQKMYTCSRVMPIARRLDCLPSIHTSRSPHSRRTSPGHLLPDRRFFNWPPRQTKTLRLGRPDGGNNTGF